MKKLTTVLFLFFGCLTAQAQNPKLDSVERLIRRATTDTACINRMNAKITLLGEVNLDSAVALCLTTIKYAQRVKYTSGEAFARMRLANNYSFKGNYAAARTNLKIAESIYTSLDDSAHLIKIYNAYGTMYGMQSKYDSSIVFFERSRIIAERTTSLPDLAIVYMNLGISYDMLSNQAQALRYQQKALTLAETQHDLNSQAYCLLNLANTYRQMGDQKRAEQHFIKAIKLARQEGIKNIELYAYTNISAMYSDSKSSRKGYEFALKAAALAKEMGDEGIQATSLSRAAINLAYQKKFAQAEALNQQAMRIADASRQPINSHQTYAAMGQILQMQANYAGAIPFFEKSFAFLKDTDIYNTETGEMYSALSVCYEKTGNYPRALTTFKTAAAIGDSVRGKENIRKATELTLTYEFDKQQLAAQAEQQKLNAQATSKQLILLAGLGVMLLLAAVSFYAYRTKQKANGLLQQQKEELQQTLTKLRATQNQLIQSEKMASLGELTVGIAHEIQNPLNFVNNFSEVSTELIDELKAERQKTNRDEALEEELLDDLAGNVGKITYHGNRASSIVKSMLEHSRTSTGQKQRIDLNALSDEYMRLAYHGLRAKDKAFTSELITHFDQSLGPVEGVPQELGRVLLNLFNNAFYAVEQKRRAGPDGYQPTVSVSTKQWDGQVEIRIRDNGTGIAQAELTKVFQPFFTTKPTGQGTGLGLSLSYDIVTKGHGGSMTVQSQAGEFTEFIIHLPDSESVCTT